MSRNDPRWDDKDWDGSIEELGITREEMFGVGSIGNPDFLKGNSFRPDVERAAITVTNVRKPIEFETAFTIDFRFSKLSKGKVSGSKAEWAKAWNVTHEDAVALALFCETGNFREDLPGKKIMLGLRPSKNRECPGRVLYVRAVQVGGKWVTPDEMRKRRQLLEYNGDDDEEED